MFHIYVLLSVRGRGKAHTKYFVKYFFGNINTLDDF